MDQIIDSMKRKTVREDDLIIEQGRYGHELFVTYSGEYSCYKNDKLVCEYKSGGLFGELALIYDAPRAATIRAKKDGVLYSLDRVKFNRIARQCNKTDYN